MKIVLAIAALLLALTSVAAEASASCVSLDQLSAPVSATAATGALDCHDAIDNAAGGEFSVCGLAAYCSLLCGVAPPAGPECGVLADFTLIDFSAAADRPHGILLNPEALPLRAVVL